MAEGFLDDDASGFGEARLGESFDRGCEQERRNLQVEHRTFGAADRLADTVVGRRICKIA